MKFLIEVLEEWPREASEQGGFQHKVPGEFKLQMVLGEDNKSVTPITIHSPALDEIPEHSLLKITRVD